MSVPTWTPDAETPPIFARLSGDYNPVHMDAAHARAAGFGDVIVHGMCTLGAAARAAVLAAPGGSLLKGLDVRFANPVLPGETVAFDWKTKDKDGELKVTLSTSLPDARKVMSPANFVFVPPGSEIAPPDEADTAAADTDVTGEPFSFSAAQLADYARITVATEEASEEAVPPMVALLGMTGALEVAFRKLQPPERAGTWVHLRQSARFFAPILADEEYSCRIQAGRNVVRESKPGVMITIPFVVERVDGDGGLVATGSCGLLYAFSEEAS